MQRSLIIITAMLASMACLSQGKRFPNMDKWMLPDVVDQRPLNGHPKQVIEYAIANADTADAAMGRQFYFLYRLDTDGDVIYKGTYYRDSLEITISYQYDENGTQSEFSGAGGKGSNNLRSKAVGNYSYRSVLTPSDGQPSAAIDSFPPDGLEQIEMRYADTATPGNLASTTHIYFDGQFGRIAKIVYSSSSGSIVERRYFRSRWFMPDSVQIWADLGTGPKLISSGILVNNAYGDPERYVTIGGIDRDTLTDTRYRYVYDRYGNWTRRTKESVKVDPQGAGGGDEFAMVREYEY